MGGRGVGGEGRARGVGGSPYTLPRRTSVPPPGCVQRATGALWGLCSHPSPQDLSLSVRAIPQQFLVQDDPVPTSLPPAADHGSSAVLASAGHGSLHHLRVPKPCLGHPAAWRSEHLGQHALSKATEPSGRPDSRHTVVFCK